MNIPKRTLFLAEFSGMDTAARSLALVAPAKGCSAGGPVDLHIRASLGVGLQNDCPNVRLYGRAAVVSSALFPEEDALVQ